MTILDRIIENKKKEIGISVGIISAKELERSQFFNRQTISLSSSIVDKARTGIIAEFKRKSPSKGILNSISNVEEVASGYFAEGASGISILTDNHFFGGSINDLMNARKNNVFPILRKEFIVDEYQVIESKSIGADAILLIAAILGKKEVHKLSKLARSLGLEVLLELHEEDEIDSICEYTNIIGINNRNLKTFKVETDRSVRLAEMIPTGFIKISESGISSAQSLNYLRNSGYDGFLIGERFMNSPDPVKAFSEFIKDLNL